MISDEEKEQVRAATDLVALVQETVELKPRGHEFWGCCPFHGEKTPSFHVIPETQVWHCFGCGEGGDCFTYVMKRENLDFPDAIRYLADRAGIELHEDRAQARTSTKRSRLYDVCEETAAYYHTMLMRGRDGRGRAYCQERALDMETCRKYRLGYAPGRGALVTHLGQKGFTPREMIDANVAVTTRNGGLSDRFFDRLMFPIMDEQGRCVAFGGRAIDNEKTTAKYLNTSETPIFHKGKQLYGFNWAKDSIVAQDEAIVVEGYISAMSCWKEGLENIVAVLGTALTEQHVRTLTRFTKKIIYLFDGDEAGQRAARRAVQFIEEDDLDLRCVILPDGMDPDDYVRAYGGEKLRELLDQSEPLIDFVLRRIRDENDVTLPGGRSKALKEACEVVYPLRDSYTIDAYYLQIADTLGLDASTVRSAAPRVFSDLSRQEEAARRRESQREAARGDTPQDVPGAAGTSAAPVPSGGGGREQPSSDGRVGGAVPVTQSRSDAEQPVYTELERQQLRGEQELLTLLTRYPDDFRPFADRIVDIEWVDPRSEAIAWAVLATPEGSGPKEAMRAARAVCPEAASLVGAGTVSSTSDHPTGTTIAFLLDAIELCVVKRRIQRTQARNRSDRTLTSGQRRELAEQVEQDSARARELERSLGNVADPFNS